MQKKKVFLVAAVVLGGVVLVATGVYGKDQRMFSWERTGHSLALKNGECTVWQFNHLQDGSERGVPYFHPLATLDGTVLTDLHPEDHRWHRGLRFAWKKINGLEGYWSWPEGLERWPENNGNTDVTAVKVFPGGDFSARFELELNYHPPGKAADLTEKRTIRVSTPDGEGIYRIDWQGVFTAGPDGAVLGRTPILGEKGGVPWGGYAGMQLRVTDRKNLNTWTIRNSGGISVANRADAGKAKRRKSLEPAHGKKARWMDLTLDFADGKTAGATLFDHPDNLRYPTAWHVSSLPNELIQTPVFQGPYTLEAGESLSMRYLFLVHPGEGDPDFLEKQWQQFAGSGGE